MRGCRGCSDYSLHGFLLACLDNDRLRGLFGGGSAITSCSLYNQMLTAPSLSPLLGDELSRGRDMRSWDGFRGPGMCGEYLALIGLASCRFHRFLGPYLGSNVPLSLFGCWVLRVEARTTHPCFFPLPGGLQWWWCKFPVRQSCPDFNPCIRVHQTPVTRPETLHL